MSEAAVFLIHPLASQKYFWAVWPSAALFQAGAAPFACRTAPERSAAYDAVYRQFPGAIFLPLEAAPRTAVYRTIRRAELPSGVQANIRYHLKQRHEQRVQALLCWGFRESDLLSRTRMKRRYRELLLRFHPDHGGSVDTFQAFYAACQLYMMPYQAAEMRSSS